MGPERSAKPTHDAQSLATPSLVEQSGRGTQFSTTGAPSNDPEAPFFLQQNQRRNSDPTASPLSSDMVTSRRPSAQMIAVPKRTIETASAELEDGTQIEIIEDPQDPTRTKLAAFNNSEVNLVDRFEAENRIFVPIARDTNLLRHVRLPRGVKDSGTARSLIHDTVDLLGQCLDISEDDLLLLAHFVLSTWFIERLAVAPYLAFFGLPRAGKSTALTALKFLCRRGLLTGDITSAAFYRAPAHADTAD